MKTKLLSLLKRFRACNSGATLVEYGIALSLAVALGIGAFATLSGKVGGQFDKASDAFDAPATTGTGG
ncbi:MAG: hypothetical protein ABIQ85_09550 [Cypionkella sp.]